MWVCSMPEDMIWNTRSVRVWVYICLRSGVLCVSYGVSWCVSSSHDHHTPKPTHTPLHIPTLIHVFIHSTQLAASMSRHHFVPRAPRHVPRPRNTALSTTPTHSCPFHCPPAPPRTPPNHTAHPLSHHRTFAKRDLQWSLIAVLQSPPSTALPPPSANTSTHTGLSSHFGCGCATTAHAATEGSATICFSKSIDDIHSPPDLITSFERSRMIRFPPASIDAMSPVASHPPCGNSPRSDLK